MNIKSSNNKIGIILMICAILSYSCMDGVIRYLSQHYNVITLGMFRYWVFASFIIILYSRKGKSLRIVSRSRNTLLQILRSIILTVELCFAHYCFYKIGLIQTSAIFAALSGQITTRITAHQKITQKNAPLGPKSPSLFFRRTPFRANSENRIKSD